MIEESFDLEEEMALAENFIRGILDPEPNTNFTSHPSPITFLDSTFSVKPVTGTSLPLPTHNSHTINPKLTWEIEGNELTFPTPPSSSSDIQADCGTAPPGILSGVHPLPFYDVSRNLALPQCDYTIRSRLEAVDNLIRILFCYRNETTEDKANSFSILLEAMRCIEVFLDAHDGHNDFKVKIMQQIRAIQAQAQVVNAMFPDTPETQQSNTKYIDQVPITFELWGEAALQFHPEDMKPAGRILLTGIFKDEMKTCTLVSRKNGKTGVASTALDSIKLNVIFKILAWWKLYGSGKDSWGAYNPKMPFNPILDPKSTTDLRYDFVQQLNQVKQKERKSRKTENCRI